MGMRFDLMLAALLALGSAAVYGAADFLGGLAARRANIVAVVFLSQLAGMVVLAVTLPLLPDAMTFPPEYDRSLRHSAAFL